MVCASGLFAVSFFQGGGGGCAREAEVAGNNELKRKHTCLRGLSGDAGSGGYERAFVVLLRI